MNEVGPIAQSVEQRTLNPWVDGSSRPESTCFIQTIWFTGFDKQEARLSCR